MSGTSLDGVDAALLQLTDSDRPRSWKLRRHLTVPFRHAQVDRLRSVARHEPTDAAELSELRRQVALDHAEAVGAVCHEASVKAEELAFVAAHGITICHAPDDGHTWQLLDGATLAVDLGTVVVCDFRGADVAAGGQGAPLAPVADWWLRGSADEDRVVLNLGGIANLTAIPAGAADTSALIAGDVGPANMVLDEVRRRQTGGAESFDLDGNTAASGRADPAIVSELLKQPWVRLPLPRSFGHEEFGVEWIDAFLDQAARLGPADQLATLVALEARAVGIFLEELAGPWRSRPGDPLAVYVTGGGRHNAALMSALTGQLPQARVDGIETLGISADAKEAVDFALLGWLTLRARVAGAAAVTGARREVILGAVHAPCLNGGGE